MLAVVKTHHIDLHIKGRIPKKLVRCLKEIYTQELQLINEEKEDFFQTSIYTSAKKEMFPGLYVKIYRENKGMTQAGLGEQVNVSKTYICDIEHNRRPISKKLAKQFTGVFDIDVSRFV